MTESEFREIVSSTRRAVLGAIRRYLSRDLTHAIDDVAQETYVRIYQYIRKHGKQALRMETAGSFAFAIAKNECLKANGKAAREKTMLASYMMDRDVQEFADLSAALEPLAATLRPVVGLYLTGYRMNEIAVKLGLAEGTVKSRLHRARSQLKERKEEWT